MPKPAELIDFTAKRARHERFVGRTALLAPVDGLDQYDAPRKTPVRAPLAALLPHTLPRGVSLLCASRPRHPYVDMLAPAGRCYSISMTSTELH